MREYIVGNSLNLIKKSNPDYNEEKLEELEYGLTGLYIFITKSIVIFSIAYFLGILGELIIFMLIYNAVRIFSFGMHAPSSIACLIASALAFLSATFLCKNIIIPINIRIILGIIGIVLMFIYSPADTEKKPIISYNWRLFYKIISTLIAFLAVTISILVSNNFIANSCVIGLLIQCFLITPFAYKITGQKYDNYKSYLNE